METLISIILLTVGSAILIIIERNYPKNHIGYLPMDNDDNWKE